MRKNKQPENPRRMRQPEPKAAVFSYYASRGNPETAHVKRTAPSRNAARPLSRWQLLPSLFAMLAVLVSIGYMLTLDVHPRLSQSTKQDNSLLQADEVYQQALEKLLKGSIFNHSKLLVNAPSLEAKMQAQFPELSSVTITIPLTNRRPILAIVGAVPAMTLKTPNGQYVLDAAGKAVLDGSRARSEVLSTLPVVQDDSGLKVEIGKTAIARVDAQFIREITHQFQAKQLKLETVTLPAAANELQVRITGEAYYIKFDTQGDARLQAGTYFALRDKLAKDNKKISEYADVRIEEKAYYK